ncbi:MAG: Gfo/Idh/MocA family oxidoreductase [Patescibacteria group bacterium]
MLRKKHVALVGLGKQAFTDHLTAVLESNIAWLEAICDTDKELLAARANELSARGITGFSSYDSIETLIENSPVDIAILCLPHFQYKSAIDAISAKGIHIIKEKPFAMSLGEAVELHELVSNRNVKMMVAVMRRFHPVFTTFNQMRGRIGRLYAIEAQQSLNVQRLDQGWRASRAHAGGGALLDLGYHMIDLLIWYFGLPSSVSARMGNAARERQTYDVEDTAFTLFDYVAPEIRTLCGSFVVSRAFPKKQEVLRVLGTKGAIEVSREHIARLDLAGNPIEQLTRTETWPSACVDQIDYFCNLIDGLDQRTELDYTRHFAHMALIDACYISASERRSVDPSAILRASGLSEALIASLTSLRFGDAHFKVPVA